MSAFVAFILANWQALLGVVASLVGVAALIAKLTPTPKDDAITAKILGWLNLLPISAKTVLDEKKKEEKITPIMKDK